MSPSLYCSNESRRALVANDGRFNGIDFLEVLDNESPPGNPPQQTLLVRCLRPVAGLTGDNVQIDGGVRITSVGVEWARAADAVDIPASLQPFLNSRLGAEERSSTLVVRTDRRGDFSTYTLRLVHSPGRRQEPPAGFDRPLSTVDFSFKVECPTEFDCASRPAGGEPSGPSPRIDYLAKDFATFRRQMFDRLSVLMPNAADRNPADMGVALVEVLAYAADYLSYHQDAVATEAYLSTARRRISVRRHARLLDYSLGEGANARAWLCLEVVPNSDADGATLPAATPVLTRDASGTHAVKDRLAAAISDGAVVFETLHPVTLRASRNQISFYTWGDRQCCLPPGATGATLKAAKSDLNLHRGDVLILEERYGPRGSDPDPTRRHVVRLTEEPVEFRDDLTNPSTVVCEVRWDAADAVPWPLNLEEISDDAEGDLGTTHTATVVYANVVLADHGYSVLNEPLDPVSPPSDRPYYPQPRRTGIVFRVPYDDEVARERPAKDATAADPSRAEPHMILHSRTDDCDIETWEPRPDLLQSDRFAREFVVEMENDRTARLRFGDNELGRRPLPGMKFEATYRVGGGSQGNVGAECLTQIVSSLTGIHRTRNPLPAIGGADPESLERARLHAPQAFRVQQRAVTEADYAVVAQLHPEVQRAVATRRWTGSWHTMFLTVDRRGGLPVDAKFEAELRGFLERYRLAGVDLEIDSPRFVPLDVALKVCVSAGYLRGRVAESLYGVFAATDLSSGRRGFFHPDNLTFGQPVFLSRIITAAMSVPGVAGVQPVRFQRWGRSAQGEIAEGRLTVARLEIARLDNDPNQPENGRLEFILEGGL